MRLVALIGILCAALWAQQTRAVVLVNDGTFLAQPLPIEAQRVWLALNHTPELIALETNASENSFSVRAQADRGTALVEVHLLPDGLHEEESLWFTYELRAQRNPFEIRLIGKRADVPAAVSNLPEGARVEQHGEWLRYEGPRGGAFAVGYLDNADRYVREQIAVLPQGLAAFNAFLEVPQGQMAHLKWRAAFELDPLLVTTPLLGEVWLDQDGLTYRASEHERGTDRVVLSFGRESDPVVIPVRVLSRLWNLKLPEGAQLESGTDRSTYRFGDGNLTWEVTRKAKGALTATLTIGETVRFFLQAPPRSTLEVTPEATLNFSHGDIALQVSREGEARGVIHGVMTAIEGAGHYRVLSGGALEALFFWPDVPQAGLYADASGLRVWQAREGERHYLGLITPSSRLWLDAQGARGEVALSAPEWFLPFGWSYGQDVNGTLLRLRPVHGEGRAQMDAPWNEPLRIRYAENDYPALPLTAVRGRLSLEAGWNRMAGQGFMALDANLTGVQKAILEGQREAELLWPRFDAALDRTLSTLHALEGGRVYHVRAATALSRDVFYVPHSPLWPVGDLAVAIPDGADAALELQNGCRLMDASGQAPLYYAQEGEYRLSCTEEAP
ncbi:MAG: hypothetical protein AB7E49_02010 [Campylobacterales bacterium]